MNEKIKALAERYHAGQTRDGKEQLPYIVHPAAVARTLVEWGEPESSPTVAMAWGHDLLEDTAVSEAEIRDAAGERVLAGIKLLTRPEEVEKPVYLDRVAASGNRDAILVKLADRICNSRDRVELYGEFDAFEYLHKADRIREAAAALPPDEAIEAALRAWEDLSASLRDPAQH